MDAALADLAKSSGIQTGADHEWPAQVDNDVVEFVQSSDPQAFYVVEQHRGLVIGPPPRDREEDRRCLAVAKSAQPIDGPDWLKRTVTASLPLDEPISALHTLLAQILIPLFDASTEAAPGSTATAIMEASSGAPGASGASSASGSSHARSRLVDAERALAQLMQHSQVAFVEMVSGAAAARASKALACPPTDQASLNVLQQIFNVWKQQIAQLASSSEDRALPTASSEIGFWVAQEAALRNALQQTESPLFRQVYERLQQSKRFQATHNFEGDTRLRASLQLATGYTHVLFRDLQLGELLAAPSIAQLSAAAEQVLAHIHRKLRPSNYPASRSILFVEAVGRDFATGLRRCCEAALDAFVDDETGECESEGENGADAASVQALRQSLCHAALTACESFDIQVRDFSTLVRELIRKRSERFAVVRVRSAHQQLAGRIAALDALCAKHVELLPLVPESRLRAAFARVISRPKLLQLSDQRWHEAEQEYSREAHAVEVAIAQQLRERLVKAASNDAELLMVFRAHHRVLARPQVRAVAHDFQTALLNRARQDLAATSKRAISLVEPSDVLLQRDALPGQVGKPAGVQQKDNNIVDRVLRMRQLDLRVKEIRERLKIVLGADWHEHSDGARIDEECERLEERLNAEPEVEKWSQQVHQHADSDFQLPVFQPAENFEDIFTVSGLYSISSSHTQLQTLKALGFRFEYSTVQAAEQLADVNSAVSRLFDAVATLKASIQLLKTFPRISAVPDVSEHAVRIMSYVRMGLTSITFNNEELYQFVTGFEHAVNLLDSRVTQLSESDAEVSEILDESSSLPIAETVDKINAVLSSSLGGGSISMSTEYAEKVREALTGVVSREICKRLAQWEPFASEHRIEIRSQQIRIVPELSSALNLWYASINQLLASAIEAGVLDTQLVEGEYGQALERISEAWTDAQNHFNAWKNLQPLWEQRIDAVELEISQISSAATQTNESGFINSDLEVIQWSKYLRDLLEARITLTSSSTTNKFLILDTTEARKQFDNKYDQWTAQICVRLAKITAEASSEFILQSRQLRRELEKTKLNASSLLAGLQVFMRTKSFLEAATNHTIPSLMEANRLLAESKFDTSSAYHQWYSSEALQLELQALQQISDQGQADLQRSKPQIQAELEQNTASRVVEAEQFKHRWQANRPLQAQVEPNLALQILSGFSNEMKDLAESIKSVTECFISLDMALPASLNRVESNTIAWTEELTVLQAGWSDLSQCWGRLSSLGSIEFMKLTADSYTELSDLYSYVQNELPETTKQLQNYQRLVNQMQKIVEQLPQLKYLRSSDAVKPHHLQKLVLNCGSKPLLRELWTHLPTFEIVEEVVELAEGEYQLLRYIGSLEEKWKSMNLIGTELTATENDLQSNPGFVLQNLDAVITLANDNLIALQGMRSSPHFEAVASTVQEWENRLGAAKQLFDKFVDAQQQYLYLRGVLTSPSVSSVLPVESRRFKSMSDEFLQLYQTAVGKPALEFASSNMRLDTNLSRLINQFASLHRSLTGFMETQRRRFPRLYFIGDDELLEIVGHPLSVWGFKHLPSLFQGVGQLIPSQNRKSDTEFSAVSPEGEVVNIVLPVNPIDNVEMLIYFEKQLKQSMRNLVFEAILELDDAWPTPHKFNAWLLKFPLQCVLLAIRERWSRTEDTQNHQSILQWLASAGDDSVLWMRRREVLVAELTHQLETPKSDLVVTVNRKQIGGTNEILVKCGPCELEYGFDFVTMEPVVRTAITDKMFLSAASAIAQSKGGSVIGPAGTGKTESVKALGTIFGKQVVVFNCDDQFDVASVERIMNGCTATQSWSCFDEFNRLSRKVLSSVAHTVSESVKKSPVFVTMNPGYSGRTVLPPNMREEFREFVLSAPDAQKISRVLLYAHGRVSPAVSDGAVKLLNQMSECASSQKHYDWGLRALKGILRVCRQLNGDMRRACEIAIRPKLMIEDLALFDREIEKIPTGNSQKSSALIPDDKCSDMHVDEKLLPYVKSLSIFINLFAGVMLLGPAGSGKSSVWQSLAQHIGAEVVVIDPSAVSKSVLLGSLDPLTREWHDGLFSRILRRVSNNLRGEKQKTWFVVLRGEVEPQWAEALNSVLDDNRQLTLASGEILSLPSNVHIIFETTNLDAATPATVSRCGMICMHQTADNLIIDGAIPKQLLDVAHNIKHAMRFSSLQAENTYAKLDMGSQYLSLAWALSGDSDNDGRMKVSDAIRQYASSTEGFKLPDGNLLSFYISDLTGQWHNWQDSVEVVKLERLDILRPDLVIPTADTAAHEALLQQALLSHRPLLLVGPPGSGKTMTLFNALRQIPQMALISLNFSSTASPELVVQALEMHCEYSTTTDGSKILSPSGSRWAALFIDEINLPQPNTNNVVPAIQFLHFLIEYGGFYNTRGEYVKLERVQLVGACNPPPQRRELPPSMLRHFMVVNVDYPARNSLQTIYSAFMTTFDAQQLVPGMLDAYEAIKNLAPNEIWTPRELTRWMRSIYTSYNATSESQQSRKLLNELFVYEGCRVLADRLEFSKQGEILHLLNSVSGASSASSNIGELSVWTYYVSKRPKFVTLDVLREFLSARLPTFIEEVSGETDKNLVMHDDFIKLVSRVDRVLRQPQGHSLIVGPSSVGKTTSLRFACWAAGLDLRMLRIHSEYGDSEFAQDLRSVLMAAIRRPICLVLTEDLLSTPEFVERMNSLLANGEVPGLFGPEHINELEEACRRAGFSPVGKSEMPANATSSAVVSGSNMLNSSYGQDDMFFWFRQKVVANLHVVFTATGVEYASPALLNRCTVIRVDHWSKTTKKQIAVQWCAKTDVGPNMVQILTELPCAGGREFIELCYQFLTVYLRRKNALEETQRHFVSGGNRLKEALLEIVHLKRHLAAQQERLETENAHSSAVLQQMLTEQSEAERKRSAAVEIRVAVQQQNSEILERKRSADEDLAAAEPLIEQAAQGVQNIKKSQLNELRSLTNPPEPVKITLEAVCMLLGLKTDGSWRQVLGAVRGDEFIPRIVSFDTNQLLHPQTARLIARIEQDFMSLPSFTYERVDRASKAGGPLFRWVVAQVAYSHALAAVKPLMIEIEKLNNQSEESQAKLSAIETMLKDLESAIDNSKEEYSKAVAQCEVLKADMHKVKSQLTRAESLLNSLDAEQGRWKQGSEQFPDNMAKLPGDALIESAQLALAGPLDVSEQESLMYTLSEIAAANNVITGNLSSIQQNQVVPKADIVKQSMAVPLIIDPNGTWEKHALEVELDFKSSSFLLDSDSLLKEVDTALRFGQHLVIKHAERFDPLLAPLLSREYMRKGARLLVNLGSGDIDVAAGFKLTLHSKDLTSIKRNRPLLLTNVSVIDFRMTPSVFEHMIGEALLRAEKPELAAKRQELQRVSAVTQNKLRKLETDLLSTLSDSGAGNLLENQQLVHSLETLKSESVQLSEVQRNTTTTLAELDGAYAQFAPTAQKASSVYEDALTYARLNPFYRIGVDWLWQIAERLVQGGCSSSEFPERFTQEVNNRIATVVSSHDAPTNAHKLTLEEVVRESDCRTPVITGLTTTNATDPTPELAAIEPSLQAIAMGSKQAAARALQVVGEAMDIGEWVVIQNAEIADESWLKQLSRKLQSVPQTHPSFRLILTGLQSELVQIPDLVASGRPVSIERVRGVRANMLQNEAVITSADSATTEEIKRLQFVLNWIHSSLTEAFPESNFSKRDFESACWLLNALQSHTNSADLQTALLDTVWQAKCAVEEQKSQMAEFARASFNSVDLPRSDFARWISMLPKDTEWLPKGLSKV